MVAPAAVDSAATCLCARCEFVECWQEGFDGVLVVKDGSNGAHAVHDGAWLHVPARDVVVVDTTGAGDAFTAGFLAEWTSSPTPAASRMTDEALIAALEAGTDLAAQAVTRTGGNPG